MIRGFIFLRFALDQVEVEVEYVPNLNPNLNPNPNLDITPGLDLNKFLRQHYQPGSFNITHIKGSVVYIEIIHDSISNKLIYKYFIIIYVY